MQAALKFESMCLDRTETLLFAGTLGGTISIVDADTLKQRSWVDAHAGTIIAITAHPTDPIIATLSMDQTAAVWQYGEDGRLDQICSVVVRDIRPASDGDNYVKNFVGNSQALGLSDTDRRLVTRTGNAGLLELDYGTGSFEIVDCSRHHGLADLIMCRYVPGTGQVLSGASDGHLALSENGVLLRDWQIGGTSIHWAEHVYGSVHLVSSDDGFVARLDIESDDDLLLGDVFSTDDVEHLAYNATSKRAFASSFDRHVYEIDPTTAQAMKRVYTAPFKNRWIATSERNPDVLFVQCRNGSLHRVDLERPERSRSVRATPLAIWSADATPDGELVLGGEGGSLLRMRVTEVDGRSRIPYFSHRKQKLVDGLTCHTKRLVVEPRSGNVVMGRTDGNIVVADDTSSAIVANVDGAVRDLTLGPGGTAYVATENGRVEQVDLASGRSTTIFTSPTNRGVFAIAHRPGTETLAVLERRGRLYLIDTTTGDIHDTGVESRRCKRAKWLDDDLLVFTASEKVVEFDRRTGETRIVVDRAGNTVEDFIIDDQRRWLLAISYLWRLYLYDYATGRPIAELRDQIDYSKGLIWLKDILPETGYPYDFATFGRSGTMHLYRLHDDNVVALGPALAAPTGISL